MYLREDLLEPIPGDNPAGIDLRYEPVYDQIKVARTEEDDIPQGDWARERKTADFPRVIELAQEALATQTKDLQLAAWLAEALLRVHGFQGFLEGLKLIRDLIASHWDHLYPELEEEDAEFRATPLEWLGHYLDFAARSVPLNAGGHSLLDYMVAQAVGYESPDQDKKAKDARQSAVDDGKLTPEEFDKAFEATPKAWYKQLTASIAACLETIDALDKDGDERFGDVAPSYSSLKGTIGEVQRVALKLLDRKLELEPDPPEAEPMPTSDQNGLEVAASSDSAPVSRAPTTVVEAAARIGEAARFLRAQNPRNPAPYALLRGFRWAEVRGGGDPPNPRLLEAPPTQVRTRLKTLLLDENWAELVEAAEEVMATAYGRGWLDLQRYVMTALTGLGPEFSPARNIIRDSLAGLLRDLPSLPDQTLMDDSPTANRQTRGWLAAEGVLATEDETGVAAPTASRPTGRAPVLSNLVAQARSQARNGNPDKAVEMLLQASERASHQREGFLHRSEAAAIMVEQGLGAVARPILDDMLQLIETHSLEGWEDGETVARPLGLLYRVRKAVGKNADDIYERICRLDPVQAVRLQNEERQEATAEAHAQPNDVAPPEGKGSAG